MHGIRAALAGPFRLFTFNPNLYGQGCAAQILGNLGRAPQVGDADRSRLQVNRTTWAGGEQARTPIPAVVVLGLSHVHLAYIDVPGGAWAPYRFLFHAVQEG